MPRNIIRDAERALKRTRIALDENGSEIGEVILSAGGIALIDKTDLPLASKYCWSLLKAPHTHYAYNSRRCLYLHRFILGINNGQMVDHINGNGLNCRRANLRACNREQNAHNQRVTVKRGRKFRSKFKGVTYLSDHPRKKPWAVQIGFKNKIYRIYCYSEIEAAIKYNQFAKELFGEFANLNQVEPK